MQIIFLLCINVAKLGVRIIGSRDDDVEGCTETVVNGQKVFAAGLTVQCIQTPGHTAGHMCYLIEHGGDRVVFTGDTLFVGGYAYHLIFFSEISFCASLCSCGKFFEGSGSDMYPSLYEKLGGLHPDTKVIYRVLRYSEISKAAFEGLCRP